MPASPGVALKALRQLGIQPVLLNALYRLGLASGHYRRVEEREQRREKREQGKRENLLRPIFAFPTPEEVLAVLGEVGKVALLAEADEIVAGKVRLFGAEPVELQLAFLGPLAHWTAYETDSSLLSAHSSLFSDIKLLWEPARFGWAFCLGRAFLVTGDEKYAETFWRNFEIFSASNPAYLGPNWVSGQEAALRLMAFVWAGQIFADSTNSTPERIAALARAVSSHASRIPATLVYARSQQNNHLLAEAAGLFTAGLALPDLPKAASWRRLGWKWLNVGLQSQIDSTGEYAQHSSNYHRLMLQVVLWTDALIRCNDFAQRPRGVSRYSWPLRTKEAIIRSIHRLLSLLDVGSGRTPNLGANDGAYIFPLTVCPFSDYRPVLNAAARAFLDLDLPRGPWDEMALWFGLPSESSYLLKSSLAKVRQPLDESSSQKFRFHEEVSQEHNLRKANLTVYRINGKDSWAYLRTVQYTTRPSHADQLNLDLWWRGLNVAQDAGTYLYNSDPPWDNSLTSALVHNTVTVNGCDQFRRAGRFLYLDWFDAFQCGSQETDPDIIQCICGWHLGYRRQAIRHERTVTAFTDGRWQVRDDMLPLRNPRNKKPNIFRLHWLLPDWEWSMESSHPGMVLRLLSPNGPVGLNIHGTGAGMESLNLFRAGVLVYQSGRQGRSSPVETAIRGWTSPTYGVKIPALSLAAEVESAFAVQFTSEFTFPL